MPKLEKIVSRDVDFAKWYTSIIINAELISYSPLKGTIILKPYAYSIWENIQEILNKYFKLKQIQNLYMPLLIPKSIFNKEKELIEGFSPECLTVTKIGDKKLEEDLIIRPTSEVLFGYFFSKELQTYKDLPMKYNQWANVFRWEKTTRPFLRTTEFLWQEGHTIHETPKEANEFAIEMINLYKDFFIKNLSIPVFMGKKTDYEKFSGAADTYTIETLMHDGQALQSGTSHYFADIFSKTFKIKFLDKNNVMQYPYYTSWGVSTRILGAIIMTHSDDNGLILPFDIAPIQIMIVTFNFDSKLIEYANKIKKQLKNYRIEISYSKKSFSYKRFESEIKGIPLRIDIGNQEIKSESVIIFRRDVSKKILIKVNNLQNEIKNIIDNYKINLYNIANNNNKKRIAKVLSFNEYKKLLSKGNYLILVPFCCKIKCEIEIKNETQTNSRCIISENIITEKCFKCNSSNSKWVYFARAY